MPEPSLLASSASPANVKKIPETGDLLIIWNQASPDEIMRGKMRQRLSAAVSKKGGISWGCRKNLYFDELSYIDPPPIRNYRPDMSMNFYSAYYNALKGLGNIPEINYPTHGKVTVPPYNLYGRDYPGIAFWKDRVIVCHKWKEYRTPHEKPNLTGVRIGLPRQWFYTVE